MQVFAHRQGLCSLFAVAAAMVALLVHAPTASAAYGFSHLRDGAGNTYSCPTWSGGADANGNFVIPCGGHLAIVSPGGRLSRLVDLPNDYPAYRDAEASPDGRYLYWVTGHLRLDITTYHHTVGWIRRMERVGNTYRYDTGFGIPPRQLGVHRWGFRNLSVDRHGNLYASVNAYVYEFREDGSLRSAFGGDDSYKPAGCGGNVGDCTSGAGLEIAEGIAVHPDGNSIYIAEQKHHHIQRWDRVAPNSPHWRRSGWVIGDRLQGGWDCGSNAVFSSPYDVGLDGRGNLFVLDTSCDRIQRYDVDSRAFRGTVGHLDVGGRTHGMATNYRGEVVVPRPGDNHHQSARRYVDPTLGGGCRPDHDLPRVGKVTGRSTGADRTVRLTIRAADGCSSVTHMKIEGDHTNAHFFKSYSRNRTIRLERNGTNYITITVRDRYGRTNDRTIAVRGSDGATSDGPAGAAGGGGNKPKPNKPKPGKTKGHKYGKGTKFRRNVRLWGPRRECASNPARMVPRGYRLLDGCVRLRARVVELQRNGNSMALLVVVGPKVTRKVWRDYPKTRRFWAVGYRSAPGMKRVRKGHKVYISGSLVYARTSHTVAVVPVTKVRKR